MTSNTAPTEMPNERSGFAGCLLIAARSPGRRLTRQEVEEYGGFDRIRVADRVPARQRHVGRPVTEEGIVRADDRCSLRHHFTLVLVASLGDAGHEHVLCLADVRRRVDEKDDPVSTGTIQVLQAAHHPLPALQSRRLLEGGARKPCRGRDRAVPRSRVFRQPCWIGQLLLLEAGNLIGPRQHLLLRRDAVENHSLGIRRRKARLEVQVAAPIPVVGIHMAPQPGGRLALQQPSARHGRRLGVVENVIVVEPDDHQIRPIRRAEAQQRRQFLARVVARHAKIPHLPVNLGFPRLQSLLEQIGVRVLVDRTVAEGDRVAEHQNPERVRAFVERVIPRVPESEVVDVHRHAGEPSVIVGRQLFEPLGIGNEETGPALLRVPREPDPRFNDHHDQHGSRSGWRRRRSGCPF